MQIAKAAWRNKASPRTNPRTQINTQRKPKTCKTRQARYIEEGKLHSNLPASMEITSVLRKALHICMLVTAVRSDMKAQFNSLRITSSCKTYDDKEAGTAGIRNSGETKTHEVATTLSLSITTTLLHKQSRNHR